MKPSTIAAAFALPAVLLCASPAFAASYTVTRTTDDFDGRCDADCSLREAIYAANASTEADEIVLKPGHYTLTRREAPDTTALTEDDTNKRGDLDIAGQLLLRGSGDGVLISGEATTSGRWISRIVDVLPGANLRMENITISKGHDHDGGGIYNAGELRLTRVKLTKNGAVNGAGLANDGTLFVDRSEIVSNIASSDYPNPEGAGIFNRGTAEVRDTTFLLNQFSFYGSVASGVGFANRGTALIRNSLFLGNYTQNGRGAGVANLEGKLTLLNSTVSGGHSGQGPQAGAVFNAAGAQMVVRSVTIAENYNGGIRNEGVLTLRSSVIAANYALLANGVDANYSSAAGNCHNEGEASISSTVIGDDGSNCPGGERVSNRPFASTRATYDGGSERLLYPLGNYGGPTLSYLPGGLTDLGVVDATDDCSEIDQRHLPRPVASASYSVVKCDIGAVERQPSDPY